jgi:hypothetical protein
VRTPSSPRAVFGVQGASGTLPRRGAAPGSDGTRAEFDLGRTTLRRPRTSRERYTTGLLPVSEVRSCEAGMGSRENTYNRLMPQPCTLCQRPGQVGDRGACNECLSQLGFATPVPEVDPPAAGCARCGHRTLIRVLLRERTASTYARGLAELAPVAATYSSELHSKLWQGSKPAEDPAKPIGIMEARICRACGFTDLYTQRSEDIPIGPEFGTQLLEISDQDPYR